MKINNGEKAAIALTLAAVIFFAGYFVGKGRSGGEFSITTGKNADISDILSGNNLTPGVSGSPGPSPNSPGAGTVKININTCSEEELLILPRIGEVLAREIVAYREEHGPFEETADIMGVSGIGEGIFSLIKDYITCRDAEEQAGN